MAFSVPNAKNYTAPLNAVPLDWTSPPVEGDKGIQCSITWDVAEAGANKSVYLNLQNNATLNFSKVRALVFDNSLNGSDVQVIFPDTETTVSIPSYTPYAVIPVFTNQTQFYIVSPNALATDKTSFMVLNTLPPPLAVPTTQEQNFFNSAAINATVTGTQQLIAAGINGTLEAVSLIGYLFADSTHNLFFDILLKDGQGNILLQSNAGAGIAGQANVKFFELTDLRLRFQNGLILQWTTTGPASSVLVTPNLYYRTP